MKKMDTYYNSLKEARSELVDNIGLMCVVKDFISNYGNVGVDIYNKGKNITFTPVKNSDSCSTYLQVALVNDKEQGYMILVNECGKSSKRVHFFNHCFNEAGVELKFVDIVAYFETTSEAQNDYDGFMYLWDPEFKDFDSCIENAKDAIKAHGYCYSISISYEERLEDCFMMYRDRHVEINRGNVNEIPSLTSSICLLNVENPFTIYTSCECVAGNLWNKDLHIYDEGVFGETITASTLQEMKNSWNQYATNYFRSIKRTGKLLEKSKMW